MSRRSAEYSSVSEDTEKDSYHGLLSPEDGREGEGFAYESDQRAPRAKHFVLNVLTSVWLPWLLTTCFASLSLFLAIKLASSSPPSIGTYEKGFSTDFVTPDQVPLEIVTFNRSPLFHPNGSLWIPPVNESLPWPENVRYIGEPTPELDDNWRKLIQRRYFSISEEEATRAWGEKRHQYVDELYGGYTAGLDVFHSLHCVNAIRMALRPDYYIHNHPNDHIDHCIDILRQTIQCYGSTTLIPTLYRDGIKDNYIDTDQTRVCRSFTYLRDLSTSRAAGQENAVQRDTTIVDPTKHLAAVAQQKLRLKHKESMKGPASHY